MADSTADDSVSGSEDRTYDVVVVGCGTGGLSAAIAAAEGGASVAVLEKAPKDRRGGQSQYAETSRLPTAETDLGLDFHVPDYTSSDFYQDVMKVTHGDADPELTQAMTNNAAETFEWLDEHLKQQQFEWHTEPPRTNMPAGRIFYNGEEFIGKLVSAAEALGADVVYEAEARELLEEDGARVRGVKAVVAGDIVRYRSDAVIIACGGFESNSEKRTRYFGGPYEQMKIRGTRYNTGEAIDMALDIGAQPDGQWSNAHMAIIDAGSPEKEGGQTMPFGYQYGIILNHNGERFVDEGEDIRSHTYAKFGRRIFEQPYREAFVIEDAKTNEFITHGGPTDPVKADSIEALVARLGIENPERAVETFEEYNAACANDVEIEPQELDGNSTSGIEPPKSNWAKPLDEPPFVGYPVTGGITFTFGGLAQNTNAEVLDTSDRPITGLYATGNATGGIFYNNYAGGSATTKALVFGKIAGANAAEYVK